MNIDMLLWPFSRGVLHSLKLEELTGPMANKIYFYTQKLTLYSTDTQFNASTTDSF